MSTRKTQILQEAVKMIATRGYAAFSMRALAKQCGLTLGALQYHYSTRDTLLRALSEYIGRQYSQSFLAHLAVVDDGTPLLNTLMDLAFIDPANERLMGDRLFPQLWAMALVEPIVEELMGGLYERYLTALEEGLRQQGVVEPRPDALVLMAMLEGLTLFTGRGQRWESGAEEALAAARAFVAARYGG